MKLLREALVGDPNGHAVRRRRPRGGVIVVAARGGEQRDGGEQRREQHHREPSSPWDHFCSSYRMVGLRLMRRPRGSPLAPAPAEDELPGEGGEDGDGDGAGQDHVVLVVGEAAGDDDAEAVGPDEAGQGGGRDDLDRRRADARRRSKASAMRSSTLPRTWNGRKPIPGWPRSCRGSDLLHAGEGVEQDGRHAEQEQPDTAGEKPSDVSARIRAISDAFGTVRPRFETSTTMNAASRPTLA